MHLLESQKMVSIQQYSFLLDSNVLTMGVGLGHPHQRIVDHLHIKKFISLEIKNKFPTICTSCQTGKSCRIPFLFVEHEIKTSFHKIHCDLWGLALVRSRE